MPRAKGGFKTRRRHKRILKLAEGFYAARSRSIRIVRQTVDTALARAYKGRKLKKRDFRKLWQTRIGAAAKENGVSYSVLMGDLKKKQVALDRKMLAELAVHSPEDFKAVVHFARN
ncbi:MAG: 50S ribosomal protein L20 [Deltaproteobacteria bacterium]|nr:50S ribosomal protein L20 [Deltaproteobacteria bacterium]